jgi:endonuclease/exonuclease/phosphatase family metal-dependent hydrolase
MRVCTYNVHLWSDAGGRTNVDAVIDVLRGLRCDVIALQEVLREGSQLDRVADALGMRRAFGAESWLGNALLSRHPLEAVTVTPITAGYEEGRCAVAATVAAPEGRFDVCATHLDPGYEVTRTRELERLLAALLGRAPAHLVMGDFNALRLADYPPTAREAVRAARALHDREEPRGDAIARMDAAGYVDAFRLGRAGDLAGYRASLEAPLADAVRASCWAGTRVDYVWASPALLERYEARDARCVDSDASDHRAVCIDFERVTA